MHQCSSFWSRIEVRPTELPSLLTLDLDLYFQSPRAVVIAHTHAKNQSKLTVIWFKRWDGVERNWRTRPILLPSSHNAVGKWSVGPEATFLYLGSRGTTIWRYPAVCSGSVRRGGRCILDRGSRRQLPLASCCTSAMKRRRRLQQKNRRRLRPSTGAVA